MVIVASILIAFALDASWEAYRQSQEERTILEGLRVDFTTSGRDLDAWLNGHRGMDVLASELLQLLRSAGPGSTAVVPVSTLYPLVAAFTYDPTTGSLDALLSSGRLEIIGNQELRAELAGWPAAIGDARAEEAGLQEFVAGDLHQTVTELVDLVEIALIRPVAFFPQDLPSEITDSVEPFQVTQPVLNAVAKRVGDNQATIRDLMIARERIDRILALIDEELTE